MAGAHDHPPAGRVPFWIHQLVELLLGGLLLVEGARTGQHTAVLVSLGAVLLLLALCSDGALGAWPWLGRRAHRVLDLVAAAVLALSPLLLGLGHLLAIVVLEVAAVAMVWLALRTDWRTAAEVVEGGEGPSVEDPGVEDTSVEDPTAETRSTPGARSSSGTAGRGGIAGRGGTVVGAGPQARRRGGPGP